MKTLSLVPKPKKLRTHIPVPALDRLDILISELQASVLRSGQPVLTKRPVRLTLVT